MQNKLLLATIYILVAENQMPLVDKEGYIQIKHSKASSITSTLNYNKSSSLAKYGRHRLQITNQKETW